MVADKVGLDSMNGKDRPYRNFLTFDTEHWYQGYRARGCANYKNFPQRDDATVEKLLTLVKKFRYSATFFVTGVFAREFPSLIKEIYDEGHELASHSYDHDLVHTFKDMKAFSDDLKRSLDVIEGIISHKVYGFRAPKWSFPVNSSDDYYKTLLQLGLRYDSSFFPSLLSRKSPSYPYEVIIENESTIWEFPATTHSFAGCNFPVAGGLWFRLFPYALSRYIFTKGAELNCPRMLYLHPYDLDPNCPRLTTANPWRNIPFQIARNYNLGTTFNRLDMILQEFPFCSIKDWLLNERPQ